MTEHINPEADCVSLDDLEAAAALYDKLARGIHYQLEEEARRSRLSKTSRTASSHSRG